MSLEASDEALLPRFVSQAHQNVSVSSSVREGQPSQITILQNVKALLTIGGWTGSQYFSTAVGSSENRTAFVNTVLDLVSKYDLDGLDFEYVSSSIFLHDEN